MTVRTLHTAAGLTLLLPFLAWIVTAMIFYLKPGYEGAYEFLQPKSYALTDALPITADTSWREVRFVRTVLGPHLLARTSRGWAQFDPVSRAPRPRPPESDIRALVADAISQNPGRYGAVAGVSGDTVTTTTGVIVTLDWNRLTLSQRGRDTDRIDLYYRIHYLQWTGVPAVDRILGPAGLALIFLLSMLGVRLAIKKK